MGVGIGNGGGFLINGFENFVFCLMINRVDLMMIMNGVVSIFVDQEVIFEEGVFYLKFNIIVVVDYEYYQLVSFGLFVCKFFFKGFFVEMGLIYMLLFFDIKWQGDIKMQSQKLYYIGIFVCGNWNFLEKKYFIFYVFVGGMVEKCVYGKLVDDKVNVKFL